ncbi:DpnI domain-containing protein [Psychrobacter pacificensis]|nr:DpnI domain-containing protein [Psychrobacter pacificensis]
MNLYFDQRLAKNYHSKSQIIRVLSETWVTENGYCP